MEITLPGVLTGPEITAWAAGIALIVGVVQQISFIPIPDGSKARAWAVSVLAAAVVVLTLPSVASPDAGQLILAGVLTWAGLASASLGLNRAGTATVKAATASEPVTAGPQG
jgi:hypothetical protein